MLCCGLLRLRGGMCCCGCLCGLVDGLGLCCLYVFPERLCCYAGLGVDVLFDFVLLQCW